MEETLNRTGRQGRRFSDQQMDKERDPQHHRKAIREKILRQQIDKGGDLNGTERQERRFSDKRGDKVTLNRTDI